jgi:tetratricopeptide (TPR) repeat protein
MTCPQCGGTNPEDAVRCGLCGKTLRSAETRREAGTRGTGAVPTPDVPTQLTPAPAAPTPDVPTQLTSPPGAAATDVVPPTRPPTAGETPAQPSALAPELRAATVLGKRYEVLGLLGEGGMGRVYKVRDLELDRVIALKTIRVEKDDEGESLRRFKQELLLSRKITHRNVVRIHDLGEAEGIKFFTMECIEGESLKQHIRKRGRLSSEEALRLAPPILDALAEAHRQGVTHRDLKPGNIMLDAQGVPYVMDFGIARSAEATSITATGALIGSPDYMSPEQVKGEKAGPQSDLFSFGVMLYEMLTGALPYGGETTISKVMKRLTERPRSPRELNGEIPKYLENVVLKCMEVDPALRYQSAAEVMADLDRQQVDRSLTLRAQRAVARQRWAAAGLLALVLAAGLYLRGRGPQAPAATEAPEGPLTSLAILPFTNASGAAELEWLRTGLPEMLVTDISQSRYVRPVSGDRVFGVLRQLGIAEQTRFDEAALESVSRLAPAQSVLHGQFVESGGTLRLDLVLRKAGSGLPVTLKVEGAARDVLALADQTTARIKGVLDLGPEQLAADTDRPLAEVATASQEALRAYEAGLAQLQRGASQAAIPLLKDATTRDPEFAMAFARLAEAYLNAGEQREAEAAAERARTLAEKPALPLAARYRIHATHAQVKEDFETAAKSYAELARLYADDPDIRFSLARTHQDLGQFPQAIEAFEKVLTLSPGYAAAVIELGRVQFNAGRFRDAIGTMQGALASGGFAKDDEALGTIHSVLGVSHRDSGDLAKASAHLKLSLEHRRKAGDRRGQSVTLTNLASVYEYEGRIDDALAAERQALAIAREMQDRARESFVLNNMGLTHTVAGDLDKALAAFRASMQIEMERGNHAELANRLDKIADIYRRKGQYDDALVYLEQAKAHLAQAGEANEEKAINLNAMGQVRKAQGLYAEAVESYLAALPVFQEIHQEMGVAMVQHELGGIYASQGRYADAFKALRQSLELYSNLHEAHDTAEVKAALGHLLVSIGKPDEAEKELAEAEALTREAKAKGILPEILLGRAAAAEARGRHADAAKAFEEANVQANLSGQKEVAVESRIELGLLYLERGDAAAAVRLLQRTRQEAAQARLRPLEAEAAAALAQALLARGDAAAARQAALDAIALADRFAGRPTLWAAHSVLARALTRLGRKPEALDAYAKAVATLDWMRGSLLPDQIGSFMARGDVRALLGEALPVLEAAGRASEVAALKQRASAGAGKPVQQR